MLAAAVHKYWLSGTWLLAATAADLPASSSASPAESNRSAPSETASFETRVKRERQHLGDEISSRIDLAGSAPSLASPSVAEHLAATAGVSVRRMGGPGDFSTLSIRGSTSTQVALYLDGVLLNGASVGTVDLSTLQVGDLERIITYRGAAPLSLGPDGMFGAVHLISRRPQGAAFRAQAAIGSFFSRQLSVSASFGNSEGSLNLSATYSGKRGDFLYRDNAGTPLTLADDRDLPRRNNDQNALQLHTDARWWKLRVLATLFLKEQGAATPVNVQDTDLRFAMWRPVLAISHDALRWSILTYRSQVSLTAQGNRTSNTAQNEQADEADARWTGTLALKPLDGLRLALSPLLSSARFVVQRPLAGNDAGQESRSRWLAGGAFEADGTWSILRAAAGTRLDVLHDTGSFAASPFSRQQLVNTSRTRAFLQPQLTLAATPLDDGAWHTEVVARLLRRSRAPTFYELFGSDGRVRGNPQLRDESQTTVDGALKGEWQHTTWGHWRGELSYAFTHANDLVVMVQNGQDLPQAQNVAASELHTIEAELTASPWKFLRLDAAYTFQQVRNLTAGIERGKPLSGRPPHSARIAATGFASWPTRASLMLEFQYIDAAFLDRGATRSAPARYPFNVRLLAQVAAAPLFVQVEVQNLFDQRTEARYIPAIDTNISVPTIDFIGYPLPGRAAYVSLVYAFSDQQRPFGEALCNDHC